MSCRCVFTIFFYFYFETIFLENILLSADEMRQKYHREGIAAKGTHTYTVMIVGFEIPEFCFPTPPPPWFFVDEFCAVMNRSRSLE